MTLTLRRALARALVAAALVLAAAGTAGAQDTTRVQRDTTRARRDSTARRPPQRPDSITVPASPRGDSLGSDSTLRQARADSASERAAARRTAADTVKAPLAHAEVPALPGVARTYRWDREAMFATGALSLTDLLREVPGFSELRGGWLLTPHHGSYFGDFRPVRVFYDGLELDQLDRRNNGLVDLSFIPIWTLEEVAVEQGAQELRIHLRSWRVRRTTPNTRVDMGTGDLNTNLYRGFFGQRYPSGASLQLIAQQFSTDDQREGGDGDQLAIFGRVGWARGRWSADVVLNRLHRTRSEQVRRDPVTGRITTDRPPLSSLDATRGDWYARAAYGDPDRGPWLQLLAGQMRFRESLESATSLTGTTGGTTGGTTTDTTTGSADTTTTRMQYVATGGLSRWGLRLSAAARLRRTFEDDFFSPSVRAAYERERVTVSAFAERRGEDSVTRLDVAAQFAPLRYLSIAGYASRVTPSDDATNQLPVTAIRGEVGVKLGRLWVSGGAVVRDSALLRAPVVFDTAFQNVREGRTVAIVGAVRGPLWKAVSLDVTALHFGTWGFYRPQTQIRSEIYASTSWLSRFPSGNFHIKFGVVHDLRTAGRFQIEGDTLLSDSYRIVSTLLEIRLLDAVLSWQYRNVVGFPYTQVPGFRMPRQQNFYGVRWDFFN